METRLKAILSVIFTTVMVSLSGAFLYILKNGAAKQYQSFNKDFDVGSPLTETLYASLNNWPIILIIIAVASYLPLFWKKRLWSGVISLMCFLGLVVIAYSPILKSGSVV
jgi:sterol desaturase/sphingolipid hydroxylase (fatty acid hydroxylase superfamily)